ncbi:MAG TPA: CAP domain-containing protein [Propionibacteriaceae bacterium]|nr:CAP domain-containing protein [Propionibacteriaceae bacterium]
MTCSGVVAHDEGNVTGTGLRIVSASAAVVVSAAVAAAALLGGSAITDPGTPIGTDQRLVAIPATGSPSPRPTLSGASTRSNRALTSRPTRHPPTRSSKSPRTAPTADKPSNVTTTKTESFKPTPTKRPTQAAKSTPSETATKRSSGYATNSAWANALLAELNAERADHGLRALKMNSKLISAAHSHNLAMAKANTLSHQLSGEAALGSRVSAAGYRWSAVAENVAYSTSRSKGGVLAMQRMMYNEKPPDDGHRQNILNKAYVEVGIDVINDSVHGKVWLVTDFGRP